MTSTAEGGATHLDFIFAVDCKYVLHMYSKVTLLSVCGALLSLFLGIKIQVFLSIQP